MVTDRSPVKRVVSIRATTKVDSPDSRWPLRATALTQPHETRTLEMVTGPRVLLTTRKGCDNIGPRGTEPKSLENSSNSASAQVADQAGPTAPRTAMTTKPYRNIVAISCSDPRDPPGATRRERGKPRESLNLFPPIG